MTREEMIALANQAGMSNLSLIDIGYLEAFANLILEKAAEKMLTLDPNPGQWAADSEYVKSLAVLEGAESIRSLKV